MSRAGCRQIGARRLEKLFAWVLSVAALAAAAAAPAAAPVPPKPEKYVTDRAGVLSESRARALNEKLADFERATSNQIVVFVDRKVPDGTTLEELANRAFREWKLGQKGNSNGVLFLVFVDDRRLRLEVGYGLEGAIPDLRAHQITDEVVKPSFRKGDYAQGIEAGVDAILAAARGEPYRGSGKTVAERVPSSSRWLAALPNDPGTLLVVLFFAMLVPAILLMLLWRAICPGRSASVRRAGSWSGGGSSESTSSYDSSSSSTSSSSDSSSSSSSSDFSGGGGDSGGGGSRDSW